jgi:TolB-like protein/DNA-binding SARP family transcriptional activator
VDGVGAAVATQHRRLAVLALLAAAGERGFTRDKLLAYLWPESPGGNARHALEQVLYALRRQVDAALFLGTDPLHLNPEVITSDLAAFEEAFEHGAVADAVALYRGPFLDGFYLGDAGEFERWVETERARLAERYAAALQRLGRQAAEEGDRVAAVEAWRKAVALDPFSSRAALGLMTALADAGERAEAIRHGRAHEALIRREFGAEPAAEVSALLRRLLSQTGDLDPASRSAGDETAARAPPDAMARDGIRSTGAPLSVLEGSPASSRRAGLRAALAGRYTEAISRRWPVAVAAGLAGLAALLFAVNPEGLRARLLSRAIAPRIHAIAVLPLGNLSGDSAQEYFAEGMTEALTTHLGTTRGLRVISHTSAMHYKGTRATLPEIARELNVDAVVEGAVLRVGNRVRVTAQLVEARTDRQLWAETYERDLRDMLGLQDAIARAITNEVQMRVSSSQPSPVASARARPVDPDAYALYLRGRAEWNEWTQPGVRKSIEYFEQAVQKDSGFAPAWAGLSDAYAASAAFNFLPPMVAWPEAKAAALRAIQLDETLSEAHVSLGMVLLHRDWSWSDAEREFQRAIALNPNNAFAHQAYGFLLGDRRQFDAAIGEMQRALELDPLTPNKQNTLAATFYRAGRYDEALQYFSQVPDPDANSESRHRRIAAIYERKGRLGEALAELVTGLRLGGKEQVAASVERAYLSSGYVEAKRTYLRGDLGEALPRAQNAYPRPSSFDIAAHYALLGQRDTAFAWLEKAFREQEGALAFLTVEDRFEALRSDPRFRDLARRIGLPDTGVSY